MAEMLVLVGDVEPGDHVGVAGAWLPVRRFSPTVEMAATAGSGRCGWSSAAGCG
jgi:hypothetical protein